MKLVREGKNKLNSGDGTKFFVIVKANGNDGVNVLYDVYLLKDTTYDKKLNKFGALSPQCSRARRFAGAVATAAVDGSVATAYIDSSGNIQIHDLQETEFTYVFPVDLTVGTGSAGSGTTACTFTYTVMDKAGNTLLIGASPAWARPALGKMAAATHGSAFRNSSGAVILDSCDEVPVKVKRSCS